MFAGTVALRHTVDAAASAYEWLPGNRVRTQQVGLEDKVFKARFRAVRTVF